MDPAGAPSSLYFRVVALEDETLRVELWERGEFHGARRIRAVEGTPQLRARRVALAAAVLARRLRGKRLAEARLAAAQRDDSTDEGTRPGYPLYGRFAIAAGALGAVVGPGDFWFVGPTLEAQLRFDSGARLDVGAAWLGGSSPAAGDAGARWLELSVSPSVGVPVSSLELTLGMTASAAAVHLSDARAVDGVVGQGDTWSGRLVASPRLEGALGRAVRWSVAPQAGVVVRRMVVLDAGGDRHRLGGLWVGGTLTVVLDPGRPSKLGGVGGGSSKKRSAGPERVPGRGAGR